MASDQSKTDMVAALSLICVEQSKRDPQLAERVAAIKAASSWERGGIVIKNGWATMPGTTEADSQVAQGLRREGERIDAHNTRDPDLQSAVLVVGRG